MGKLGRITAAAALVLCTAACDARESQQAEADAVAPLPGAEPLDPALAALLPEGSSMEEAERGRELYAVCSVCHGVSGEGTQLGPSLRDGEWLIAEPSIESLAQVIRAGVDPPQQFPIPMPAGGGGRFDDAELQAVSTYVYLIARQGEG